MLKSKKAVASAALMMVSALPGAALAADAACTNPRLSKYIDYASERDSQLRHQVFENGDIAMAGDRKLGELQVERITKEALEKSLRRILMIPEPARQELGRVSQNPFLVDGGRFSTQALVARIRSAADLSHLESVMELSRPAPASVRAQALFEIEHALQSTMADSMRRLDLQEQTRLELADEDFRHEQKLRSGDLLGAAARLAPVTALAVQKVRDPDAERRLAIQKLEIRTEFAKRRLMVIAEQRRVLKTLAETAQITCAELDADAARLAAAKKRAAEAEKHVGRSKRSATGSRAGRAGE